MGAMSLFVSCALTLSAAQSSASGRCVEYPSLIDNLPIAAPAPSEQASPFALWQAFIAEGARRYGLPEAWIRTVIDAESGGRTFLSGRPITSPKGAIGLMQIMPGTYQDLRTRYGFGHDPYQPRDNILAGSAYLRELYDRYGYPNLFAAYNAGPKRFDRYLFGRKPLPDETLSYVNRIVPGAIDPPAQPLQQPRVAPNARPANALFFSDSASRALFITRISNSR